MTSSIPLVDLARLHDSIRPELDNAIQRVIANSAFIGGEEVEMFEDEFSHAHDLVHGASCGSGTDALTLALLASGVGPGDEVIVPAMTFVATAEAVYHAGATPIIADVDRDTLLLIPQTVEEVRTRQTKAIIPVHLYGHIVPFHFIDLWKEQGLVVIEDAAQAHIGQWESHYVGSHGDAACFSFYPGKNLGALGDGGMVLSTDEQIVTEVRRLRDHGRVSKYVHETPGWCSRLDGLQAAVLRIKLRHLRRWTKARREIAHRYSTQLGFELVPWRDGAVHHLVVARFQSRERLAQKLHEVGVATGLHYPMSLAEQPWLSRSGHNPEAAERASKEVLSLPIDPLMTLEEVDRVCDLLLDLVGQKNRYEPVDTSAASTRARPDDASNE